VTQIVIAAIVVGGLIICVIVISVVVIILHVGKHRRKELTEADVIPMDATTASQNYSNDAFENPACINNLHGDLQQPSGPVAGAVGGVAAGNIYRDEPSAMYESLSDDQRDSPQVHASFETFKGN